MFESIEADKVAPDSLRERAATAVPAKARLISQLSDQTTVQNRKMTCSRQKNGSITVEMQDKTDRQLMIS